MCNKLQSDTSRMGSLTNANLKPSSINDHLNNLQLVSLKRYLYWVTLCMNVMILQCQGQYEGNSWYVEVVLPAMSVLMESKGYRKRK